MKLKKMRMDYLTVVKYLILFVALMIFGSLEKDFTLYSTSIYVTSLTLGSGVIVSSILYLCTFLIMGKVGLIAAASIVCGFFAIILAIYKSKKTRPRIEFSAYVIIGMLGFIFLGDTSTFVSIERRFLISAFTSVLTLVMIIAGYTITEKGLKFKLGYEDFATLIIALTLTGLGVSNLITPYLWRGISAFLILLATYVYKTGISTLISAVLGLGLAVYYGDITYVAVLVVWGVFAIGFMPISRYVATIAVVLCDYLIQVVFKFYPTYSLAQLLSILIGALVFAIIPTAPLKNLKEKLYAFREKQLVRQSINRNRLMLSNRLFELSGVFNEMSNAFGTLQKEGLSESGVKKAILEEICTNVCVQCEFASTCRLSEDKIKKDVSKLIDIGLAKGKTSLIDLPRELGNGCIKPNSILFAVNKLLADYRTYTIDNLNVKTGRDLIAAQAQGVSEILRGVALETGTLLKYQSRLERELGNALFKKGFLVSEILIYGDEERTTVSLILTMKEFSLDQLQKVISDTVGMQMTLFEKADVNEDKCYLCFKKIADYDAVFGVATTTKDGSMKCGDTHSVIRIKDDKFLVAISDGMGSGERAENVSSTSLSLIESFYKAGLKGNLILNTVNKLLAVNTEDTFTALDISVIDLKTCTADFIKYGAPYGFIIGETGIKIVESNTLPLGILDELKPSVCHSGLNDGDMLLLVSDGISDAFGCSAEVIDFLKTVPAKNPQTLADQTLEQALIRTNGLKKDDMTALCVRIFKTSA